MRRYIGADLNRVFHRKPRLILWALIMIVVLGLGLMGSDDVANTIDEGVSTMLSFFVIIIGVLEMIFVYGDDFKAKTTQIAIGCGIPRRKVVHAKWLEIMILAMIDLIFVVVGFCIFPCFFSKGFAGSHLSNVFIVAFMTWLSIVAYYGIVMIIMFQAQGISLAMIIYIILSSNILVTAVKYGSSVLGFSKLHLHTFLLGNILKVAQSRLLLGNFHISSWIGIFIYLILSFALTMTLFKRRELEF